MLDVGRDTHIYLMFKILESPDLGSSPVVDSGHWTLGAGVQECFIACGQGRAGLGCVECGSIDMEL